MKRLHWLSLWDQLRTKLQERTTWGRTQILDEMDKLERDMVRKIEQENESERGDLS